MGGTGIWCSLWEAARRLEHTPARRRHRESPGTLLAALAIRTIRLLAEQDLGKHMAMREQSQTYLAETWGE